MMRYEMLCSDISYDRESVVLGDHSSLFCKGSTHRFESGPQCSKLQGQASFPHPPLKSLFLEPWRMGVERSRHCPQTLEAGVACDEDREPAREIASLRLCSLSFCKCHRGL